MDSTPWARLFGLFLGLHCLRCEYSEMQRLDAGEQKPGKNKKRQVPLCRRPKSKSATEFGMKC
jgi:hypothetical protein